MLTLETDRVCDEITTFAVFLIANLAMRKTFLLSFTYKHMAKYAKQRLRMEYKKKKIKLRAHIPLLVKRMQRALV
jgi:hypothetical protein